MASHEISLSFFGIVLVVLSGSSEAELNKLHQEMCGFESGGVGWMDERAVMLTV
jgi:hypothetical protein